MPEATPLGQRRVLLALNAEIERIGSDLEIFLVYDRPERATERPGLARSFFAERCVPEEQLDQTVQAFETIGAAVHRFDGERPFIGALADGTLLRTGRRIKIVYNGIEGSIAHDAFQPGRKSLLPALADAYGIACANSDAYACSLGRHKFHYLAVLERLGLPVPATWHYQPGLGWAGGLAPPAGLKVIVKSTYESWSVGVTDSSVFHVDQTCEERVASIATEIGQPATVQAFIAGREICVPVLTTPDHLTLPPVETVLARSPGDPDSIMTIGDNLSHGAVRYRPSGHEPWAPEVSVLARKAFIALQLKGLGRIDFRVDEAGRPHVFDVGVSPGLGRGSSAFASAAVLGISHEQFLRAVLASSLAVQGLLG